MANNNKKEALYIYPPFTKSLSPAAKKDAIVLLTHTEKAARVDALNQIKSPAKRSDKTPGKSHFKYK